MSAALSVFKLSVQNVHQLQQHTIEVSFEMTGLLINELLWQIIPYRQQGSLQFDNVGRLWHVFLIASQHCASHMIIQVTD